MSLQNKPGRPKSVTARKTFKDYYCEPEFREKHMNYLKEKICCEQCGKNITRVNMNRHKQSKMCVKQCGIDKTDEMNSLKEQCNLLQIELNKILQKL